MTHILVVDDEPDIRAVVRDILEDEGYAVSVAENGSVARHARRERRPDLILLDIWMPDVDGLTLLKEWEENGRQEIPVVVMSGHGTVETAVEATRHGAFDFIEKPLSMGKLLVTLTRALETAELKRENLGLRQRATTGAVYLNEQGPLASLYEKARRVANHSAPLFIRGESGTGKEVLARYIHQHSDRSAGPFASISVAALARDNPELQLFGSEDGDTVHFGTIEKHNGGTILMKDVADMDLALQAQILSAIESQSILRVGGTERVAIDVRFAMATRSDLAEEVARGRFRDDLYYQLNILPLVVPPLKERLQEIDALAEHFIDHFAGSEGLPRRRLAPSARARLREHDWPGNVRELKNLVQRLLILGSEDDIESTEVAVALGMRTPSAATPSLVGFDLPLREAREKFEKAYLEYQLAELGGSVSKVAERIGIERTHLYRKLRALDIDPKQIKEATRS